ncbi:MAG: lysophospholipase [Bacteroidia bacterium]|jgi:hypothetical protein|nr:lysophospholipase [Bacteroidia bacterium]
MRYATSLFLLTIALGSFTSKAQEKYVNTSNRMARWMQLHQFDSAHHCFSLDLKLAVSVAQIEQQVSQLESVYGKWETNRTPDVEFIPSIGWRSTIPLVFANNLLTMMLTFDSNGCVSNWMLIPRFTAYLIPDYANTFTFTETPYTFGKPGWQLNGVLSIPNSSNKMPAAIIIHDSGPIDKDGTVGLVRMYKDLAYGLASKGICVFRYEKRSYAHGNKLFMQNYQDKPYTLADEVTDDASLAIALLKTNPNIDTNQIYIIGHGQGGTMAPYIAKQHPEIAGMVLLGAYARPIQQSIIDQLNYLYPDSSQLNYQDYAYATKLKREAAYTMSKKFSMRTPKDSLPNQITASYWISVNAYKQTEVFKQVQTPALILQGERDYQANSTDIALWQKAAALRTAPTQFKTYPTLNHLLVAGQGPSKPIEYQTQGNVAESIIQQISMWMQQPK